MRATLAELKAAFPSDDERTARFRIRAVDAGWDVDEARLQFGCELAAEFEQLKRTNAELQEEHRSLLERISQLEQKHRVQRERTGSKGWRPPTGRISRADMR